MTIELDAFRDFQKQLHRWARIAWALAIVLCVGTFFILGIAWSDLAGLIAMVVLVSLFYECAGRLSKAVWRHRFPELKDTSVKWGPSTGERAVEQWARVAKDSQRQRD
jgi:O-antigen/teichoic acid export membrane protein